MKTTTVELTPDKVQALIDICDVATKAAGLQILGRINTVLPIVVEAQQAFNAQGNGAVPVEQIPEVGAKGPQEKSKKKATDLEGKI